MSWIEISVKQLSTPDPRFLENEASDEVMMGSRVRPGYAAPDGIVSINDLSIGLLAECEHVCALGGFCLYCFHEKAI